MSGYPFALALSAVTLVFIVHLLRSRRLREKYAAIWVVVLIGVMTLGAFPAVLVTIATTVGVETPSNLLFATSLVVLLLVCIQLSTELSGLEEESRTLAEELALLGERVNRLTTRVGDDGPLPAVDPATGEPGETPPDGTGTGTGR